MPLSIAGKTILVTGASSGLGQHFAGFLADEGARVVLAARRLDRVEAEAQRIREKGGAAQAVAMDVTDPGSVAAAIDAVERRLDVVVNNAGIAPGGDALSMAQADFDAVIATNLTGAFTVSQAAARRMAGECGGAIVNIASILGLRVAGHVSAYAASKAALIQMTKAHALEWARHGIRVNALCPGYVETPLNRDFFASDQGQALIRRIPQRRLGQLSDLDGPLLLLISDASAYMTGAVIAVDGGHLVSSL